MLNVLQSLPTLLPMQYGGYVRIRDRLTQAEAAAKVCTRWKGKLGLLQLVWTAAWPARGAHAVPQEVGSVQAAQVRLLQQGHPPSRLPCTRPLLPQTPEVQEQRREPNPPRIYGEADG